MGLESLTIHEARKKLDNKELSSVELTKAILDRIEKTEEKINSYVTVASDEAMKGAKAADEMIASGEAKPLTGIPLAIKDIFCTKGLRTTCSSKMLHNFVPPYDATAISRLKAAGAVLVGKTNMDEFAMGSSTETSHFRTTKNPWDITRIPGGSSGGSATSVSADQCIASLGTDTGGSIRQPASLCGIVGLKPTYGRVSRYGVIAFASSLDQVGPMTKDVEDSAILLGSIAGFDPKDSTSIKTDVPDYKAMLTGDINGLKIGVPKEYFVDGMDAGVEQAVRKSIDDMKSMGAEIVEISLPHTEYAVAVYYIVAPAEASSNLARFDGVKYGHRAPEADSLIDMYKKTRSEGFGQEVKRRIMLGTYALSAGYYDAYYLKAQKVRTLIARDFKEAFEKCDVIVTPTTPTTAFCIGEKNDDPLQMYLSDILTISCNLAGIPGISIPCGFSKEGLPIGLQILGNHFDEVTILRAAHSYEQSTAWHKERPVI
ncbi:MAG: Asp-tRNA(Asn)/Glu-tRNA(Gln) amidotransferase subunit GatA [bacterium]|nr:Asp-tRNA(Asn)/Glu-tRNA(Gln) amidotransferase subunit GatA [bacterium]